jgi:hypothetical protein
MPNFMNKMPNFLIIGAHKSGTTSLYHYLKQHPQIYMSPVKEPHFFSFLDHPLDFREPGFDPQKLQAAADLPAYQALFQQAGDAVAIGEASPSYLYVEETAVKIYQHLPQVNIIAVLRNPADRAYSNYLHCRARKHQEPLADFSDALKAEKKRIQENWSPLWHYQQKGFYFQQLQRYYRLFNNEQIRIYLYDDLLADPQALVQDIYQFLQVDASFTPNLAKKHNVSGLPKNKLWQFAYWNLQWGSAIIPPKIKQKIKANTLTRPTIPPTARKQLIDLYRNDILQLQALIQRDLTHWLGE